MTQKTFNSQTATFIGRLANSFPADLTGPEMQKCIDDPKGLQNALLRWLRSTEADLVVAATLLTQVGDLVTIPASTQKFIAAKKFVVNTANTAELKISYLDDNFKSWFLDRDFRIWFLEKPEEAFIGSKLKVQKLNKNSVDRLILDEVGGEEKAETVLYEMFEFLKTAEHRRYFFYIKGDSRFHAVFVRWNGGGWDLNALELHSVDEWGADDQIVSRN